MKAVADGTKQGPPGPPPVVSLSVGPSARSRLHRARAELQALFALNRGESLQANRVALMALFVAGFALALVRLAPAETFRSFWAEDGAVFLRGAEIYPWLDTVFRPYGGYMHMFPRIIAGIASLFPLQDAAGVMNTLQALVHAGCAIFAFYCLRGYVRLPILRVIAVLVVCTASVGAETADFTGGLQFMVLPVSVVAVLWTPRSRITCLAGCAFLYAACASTPFGVIPALLFLLRLWVERTRISAGLFAAAAAGTVTQGIAMLGGTRPDQSGLVSVQPKPGVANMLERYVAHLSGQVTLGDRLANAISFDDLRLVGVCVVAVVMAGAVLSTAARRDSRRYLPIVMLAVSFVLFAAPVYLNAPPLTEALFSSRYDLPAGIGFTITLTVLLDVMVADVRGRVGWFGRAEWTLLLLCGLVTAAVFLATVDNIKTFYAVSRTDNWPANLAGARSECVGKPADHPVTISESPPNSSIVLPCRVIG